MSGPLGALPRGATDQARDPLVVVRAWTGRAEFFTRAFHTALKEAGMPLSHALGGDTDALPGPSIRWMGPSYIRTYASLHKMIGNKHVFLLSIDL